MKQSLQLRLNQQLTLTPQLQQSIRLLQLSTLELQQEISQALQDNPMLERADVSEGEGGDYETTEPAPESGGLESEEVYAELAWGDRSVAGPGSGEDDDELGFQQPDASQAGLRQHLLDQLSLTPVAERDRRLVALLIDALDEDGYLTVSLEELAEMLPEDAEYDLVELEAALKLLQSFDPVGVGARDLAECLCLQLATLPPETPWLAEARRLAREGLKMLAEHEYGKLKKWLGIALDADFQAVRALITGLNPRPGARYAEVSAQYVVPDVLVRKLRGQWQASLNPAAMPKLRINEMYAGILRQNRAGGSLQTQLQEARWLIKNVQQRFETILRVAQAIVERQRLFFEHGPTAMRPLVLREIAEQLDLHESTVSRVTSQKYMLTPRGLFEFKYFFCSSLGTEEGGATSSTAIKALIKQAIEAENRGQPLSDSAISTMLGKQGYVVARRTVAKYREQMQIPPANQRKSI
ncbi:RNA polymerase RpoN-/SigL-like sigma 54 subunit [Sulfuritortus calidifontis]|uniref:RNA polymerase sigma-54 factor n=1 Tax=Sulfuritortus calidifontis TaxID=1914471 RepID=A0A4R3JT79_9PROT|nr:RNA polymerase factor sigma-54 [Sulfuritortus calidifontis]TCS70450.1 RNA polymerase RpoN-/SigL-like sigma 54 subunit [Sulfuritortus calidifontis]